ncbi:MAG: hypothetical protein LQ337_008415 [Flavoplaca oasis]|nr:MAG: hypothetical protein LQ337_008415 [Flavoplaca oasis]
MKEWAQRRATQWVLGCLLDDWTGVYIFERLRFLEELEPSPSPIQIFIRGPFKFNVPNTETIITFSNWAKLLYREDVHLCLLEGMGDLTYRALRAEKGDRPVIGNKFRTSYGKATIIMDSYSPPAFRLTISILVDTLRGIGLFMSLYGYYEVEFDIENRKLGHVGVGSVQYL